MASDCFGFSCPPQIMAGCGIKYFATQKLLRFYNDGDPPYNIFMWEGSWYQIHHVFVEQLPHRSGDAIQLGRGPQSREIGVLVSLGRGMEAVRPVSRGYAGGCRTWRVRPHPDEYPCSSSRTWRARVSQVYVGELLPGPGHVHRKRRPKGNRQSSSSPEAEFCWRPDSLAGVSILTAAGTAVKWCRSISSTMFYPALHLGFMQKRAGLRGLATRL